MTDLGSQLSAQRRFIVNVTFRFQNLDIWQRASEVARRLFRIADSLEEKKRFRFAEQLRGAALSMPNNIAEGSGSTSKREFIRYLDIARKSIFENASMILIFAQDHLISQKDEESILRELDELSRMITAFSRSLNKKDGR